jgi:hypothetical protein
MWDTMLVPCIMTHAWPDMLHVPDSTPLIASGVCLMQSCDAASQGLIVANAQRLLLDMHTGKVAVQLPTATNVYTCQSMVVGGTVVMGRMTSLRPSLKCLQLPIGTWHTRAAYVPARGCQAPIKAYTDVQLTTSGGSVVVSGGLEPSLAALARASKRLLPTDVTAAAGVTPPNTAQAQLAWWDRMRYQWRGRLSCRCTDAAVTLLPCAACFNKAPQQSLVITLGEGSLLSSPDGQLALSGTSVRGAAFIMQREGRSRPDACQLRVPLCALSSVSIHLTVAVTLPGHRSMGDHHVFPVFELGRDVLQHDGVQGPIDVAGIIAAQAISLQIVVGFRNGSTVSQVRSNRPVRPLLLSYVSACKRLLEDGCVQ